MAFLSVPPTRSPSRRNGTVLVDYVKLKAMVGPSLPTGAGGTISEVEGPVSTTKAYFVDARFSPVRRQQRSRGDAGRLD